MTLPDEYVSLFNTLLTSAKKEPKKTQIIRKDLFHYTHEKDFLYGERTGMFIGYLLGWWEGTFRQNPSEEEFTEIIDMFQEHIDEIKRSVSGLKN